MSCPVLKLCCCDSLPLWTWLFIHAGPLTWTSHGIWHRSRKSPEN